MTKLHLTNLLTINKKIGKIDNDIIEIRERITSPKNQIISDMPKGSGATESVIDTALAKIERLEKRKSYWHDTLMSEWLECEEVLSKCGLTREHIELMKFRYYHALKWEHCLVMMKKRHTTMIWNKNKVFRMNRQVVENCFKNGYEVC